MNELNIDVTRIESALKPLQKKMKFPMFFGVAAFAFYFIIIMLLSMSDAGEALGDIIVSSSVFVLFVITIVCAVLYSASRKKYVKEFKNVIGIPVLNSIFDSAAYYPERGFTKEEFKMARLIKWRSDFNYRTEDLIEGVHRGVRFRQADLRITHTTGSGKNRRTVVDVDGRIWKFDCPKQVNSRVLIVKDWNHAGLEGGLKKVEMENVEFNKLFNVYAEDAHSAFYVLTPHFMEYIKSLHGHARAIYISFDGVNLYFMQSGTGGIFEPSSTRLDVQAEVTKAQNELQVINKIIDALKIDSM